MTAGTATGSSRGSREGAGASRVAGVIVWVIGVWTTWLFVSALAVPEPFLVALALQSALTAAQSAFWAGKRDTLALAAVGIDALINYGGLYPYLQNISATPTYTQLSSAFDFIPATAPQWVVGSFSLAICIIIAGLPELLWKRGRRSRE